MVQVHSLHAPCPAESAHNRHAISQVIGNDQRRAVRRGGQSCRIECRFPFVVIRWRLFTRIADLQERRRYFRIRSRRARPDRRRGLRIKTKNPHFVLESAGNVHLITSAGPRRGRKSQSHIRALRRGKIYVLDHHRLGTCAEVNDRNRLLGFTRVLAELDAITAVHH